MKAILEPTPVVEKVRQAFRNSGLSGLCVLKIDFLNGRLRIEGSLPLYYLKQMAQEVAGKVDGVTEVDNAVEVT